MSTMGNSVLKMRTLATSLNLSLPILRPLAGTVYSKHLKAGFKLQDFLVNAKDHSCYGSSGNGSKRLLLPYAG